VPPSPAPGAKPLFEHMKIGGQMADVAGEIRHFSNC
jgi:hypothetical protein